MVMAQVSVACDYMCQVAEKQLEHKRTAQFTVSLRVCLPPDRQHHQAGECAAAHMCTTYNVWYALNAAALVYTTYQTAERHTRSLSVLLMSIHTFVCDPLPAAGPAVALHGQAAGRRCQLLWHAAEQLQRAAAAGRVAVRYGGGGGKGARGRGAHVVSSSDVTNDTA
jgi:hypothetical protein